eukprot:TRINITY_DN3390_c0_g1_i1.p1 TRINITY_DN3390_c0_g1~~TRINITY_DN3390_c0_g1_i1.p1  ORF type:complete len:324 (-),score=12.40 TRINITY_DN3390_c0_g1_i1:76-1047(-)
MLNCTKTPALCKTLAHQVSMATSAYAAATILSLLGCLFVISSMFFLSLHRKRAMRFVLYVTLSDLFATIGGFAIFTHIGTGIPQGFWCQWQTLWATFANLSGAGFNVVTAFYVFACVVLNKKPGKKYEACCQLIWLTSLVLTFVGYMVAPPTVWATPAIGGIACFISDAYALARSLMVHLAMGLSILLVLVLYGWVAVFVYRGTQERSADTRQNSRKRRTVFLLAVYPLIFFGLWFWPVVARAAQTVTAPPAEFMQFSIVVMPWLGFVNAIWYTYSKDILKRLLKMLQKEYKMFLWIEADSLSRSTAEGSDSHKTATVSNVVA